MAEIKLKNIKKIYDNDVVAVHDFNLHIKDKEFIVFVGPSGCGKSTTLRMIAGLEDISDGICEIDGEIVNDYEPKDRGIAMVFQNYALYPHMTVFENMAFSLRLRKYKVQIPVVDDAGNPVLDEEGNPKYTEKVAKLPEDEIYRRVTEAAETLNITEYLTRKPRALSGGQRQRVAIGRAMVRESKVFLMDEPLSNLDAKLRNQMRAEIILLRKKIDSTFIYVTHDQTEAMTLGDRIVIMKDGFIQQVGTPTEVFDKPVNLFVASFIGAPQMNFFDCELVREGDSYNVSINGVMIPVDGKKAEELLAKDIPSRKIILGVRPEHMVISEFDGFPCKLTVNEMMGSELHLHADCASNKNIIVRVPTISLSDEEKASLVAGAEFNVSFSGKVMHFFDQESGDNLLYSYEPVVFPEDAAAEEVVESEEK